MRLVHLLDGLRALLDARPEYASFLLDGQTAVLADYLDVRPDARADLERLGRAGRLEVGPWYVLPDTFLVSGEALVRNLARGREDARPFGGAPPVGYVPDSFGHTAQLPQLFRGFGFDVAVAWRGFGGEPGQEGDAYRWRAPDGSEVRMAHLPADGYSAAYFDDASPAALESQWAGIAARSGARARTPDVLVLSGGDHHFPVAHFSDAVARLNACAVPDRVVHSTLRAFATAFASADADAWPVANGELRFGYRWAFNVTGGVYSSRMPLKQANARAERWLERLLEPLDALATRAGGGSQRALLRLGWTYLLQNHPHDTVCGCSVDAVHREQLGRFEKLSALGDGVVAFAWMTLADGAEGESGDTGTITVFNPAPHARDAIATFSVDFFVQQEIVGLNPGGVVAPPHPPVAGFALVGADGALVPFEVVGREQTSTFALARFGYPAQARVERFTVRADLRALPPLGLRTLAVVRTDGFAPAPQSGLRSGHVGGETAWIESAALRVEARGGAFFVTDRATGTTFGPLGHLEDGADAGDLYNYSPPAHDEVLLSTDAEGLSATARADTLEAALTVSGTWMLPEALDGDRRSERRVPVLFATTATLGPHDGFVRFRTTADNTARDHRLRVRVETGRATNTHHADAAFAVVTREQHAYDPAGFAIEVPTSVAPMHRFVTVEDAAGAATLLADGLPEYELVHNSGGRLCLTLLRCVGELARGDLSMRPGGRAGWAAATPEAQCAGRHAFRWAFLPHGPGDLADARARAADAFLLPPVAHGAVGGIARPDRPALALDPPALTLSAFKTADDGAGIVVRVYNPTAEPLTGTLHFFDAPASVRRAALDEAPGEPLALGADGVLADTWSPFRIHTYRAAWAPHGP